MGELSDLPESESALYELATRSDEDPYTRESAIKKLGSLDTEASTRQLATLAEEGVSAIERQLARKYYSGKTSNFVRRWGHQVTMDKRQKIVSLTE